jgi:hypothetical protein
VRRNKRTTRYKKKKKKIYEGKNERWRKVERKWRKTGQEVRSLDTKRLAGRE